MVAIPEISGKSLGMVDPIAFQTMTEIYGKSMGNDTPGDGITTCSNTSPRSCCESLYQEKSGQTAQSALMKAGLANRSSDLHSLSHLMSGNQT